MPWPCLGQSPGVGRAGPGPADGSGRRSTTASGPGNTTAVCPSVYRTTNGGPPLAPRTSTISTVWSAWPTVRPCTRSRSPTRACMIRLLSPLPSACSGSQQEERATPTHGGSSGPSAAGRSGRCRRRRAARRTQDSSVCSPPLRSDQARPRRPAVRGASRSPAESDHPRTGCRTGQRRLLRLNWTIPATTSRTGRSNPHSSQPFMPPSVRRRPGGEITPRG